MGKIKLDLKKLTNNELIRRCAEDSNNRLLWEEFYLRFDERIWLIVYRESRDRGLAENKDQFSATVQDLVQDVYLNLLKNECKALENFIGASEHSIYTYLGIIARNVVRNHITMLNAQKRPAIQRPSSINQSEFEGDLYAGFREPHENPIEPELDFQTLKDNIELIFDQYIDDKYKERNKLIFKLYFYEGLSPDEIASKLGFEVTSKRVLNLVGELKILLRRELMNRNVEAYL